MKRKLKLKYWVKAALISIPFMILCLMTLNKVDEGFIENCMNHGYSRSYCERSR